MFVASHVSEIASQITTFVPFAVMTLEKILISLSAIDAGMFSSKVVQHRQLCSDYTSTTA